MALHKRSASIEFYRGASFLKMQVEKDREISTPPKVRGEITEFSDAARRRMLDFMAKIDGSLVPLFVTLTYPDQFPSYQETFKNHLDLLGQRIRRRWPEAFIVWKLEFQKRKSGENAEKLAPHYHLFVYGVPKKFPFRREVGSSYSLNERHNRYHPEIKLWELSVLDQCVDGWCQEEGHPELLDSLRGWMSRNWFEIVGSKDPKHFRAGTRVEELLSTKGAFYYAAKKYLGKGEDCSGLEIRPGRFWGVIGRSKVKLGKREVRSIPAAKAFVILRLIRRYRRAKTPPEKRKFLKSDQFSAKCSGVNRGPRTFWPCAASRPAAALTSSGKNGSMSMPPATIASRWQSSRRIRSRARPSAMAQNDLDATLASLTYECNLDAFNRGGYPAVQHNCPALIL